MIIVNKEMLEMMRIIFLCIVTGAWNVAGQCSFPFNGTWVSSSDGTWTVNSSHLLDFKVTGISGVSTLSFTCFETQGNLYTLQSTVTVEIFNGVFKTLYTCLDIRFSSSVKYVYYKNTDTGSPTANEMTIQSTFSSICNKASYDEPYYHHVALMSGSETSALENCPESLFGSFTYNTCTDPGSNSTSMNVCDTRQQLIYNYTMCDTEQMFSAEGVLDCVYFVASGAVTYLTVYNRDSTTPDEVSYFRFSCLAIEESGSTRMITANPEQCVANQDPSTITSPGQAIQFEPYYLCLITTTVSTTSTTVSSTTLTHSTTEAIVSNTSEASTNIGLIIGIVAAIIVLAIIVALIILCCCLRKRRQRKKVDEEQAIAEDTDDQRSHRSDDRRSSGSSSQDEDKRSVDSGIGREPLSGRATRSDYKRLDDQEQEEDVVKTVGELDVDDKSSRPRSGQVEFRHLHN